ncbi:MAG: energy transducer TonB [Acidobacteria bacterium]|nr:energy transducer TonB [Acidobacteriota bacterium]
MRYPPYASSALVHLAVIAAIFLFRVSEEILPAPLSPVQPPVRLTLAAPAPLAGGGGGMEARPASKGRTPRVADLVFIPPTSHAPSLDPALPIEPAVLAISTPSAWMPSLGAPDGLPGPPSDGPGRRGGIGPGPGGGGIGPERGGNAGGSQAILGVSTPPQLIYRVEPEYSDQARQARFNGSVLLRIVVDEQGRPRDIEVVRGAGLGLDERAIQAVEKWRFRPARRGSRTVPVPATVEVNFRLL